MGLDDNEMLDRNARQDDETALKSSAYLWLWDDGGGGTWRKAACDSSGKIETAGGGISGTIKEAEANTTSSSWANVLNITSGVGNLLFVRCYLKAQGYSYGSMKVTIDGGTAMDFAYVYPRWAHSANNPTYADMFPFAGVPFTTSLKVEHVRYGSVGTLYTSVCYTEV